MRFLLLFGLRLTGLRIISLILIITLSVQMVYMAQKWYLLPRYTLIQEAEKRVSTFKKLWKRQSELADEYHSHSNPFMQGLKEKPDFKTAFTGVRDNTMGLTPEAIKQLPLSQVQGEVQGLYIANPNESIASHCLITLRGVTLNLSVGDHLEPDVCVMQIIKEGVVFREHGRLAFLPYKEIN